MALGNILGGAAGGASVVILIKAIDSFSGVFKNVNKQLLGLGTAITGIGIAGGIAVGGLIKLAGQFEQTQIAFTTMLGSADVANELLQELADFAAKTPFNIPGVELAAKQLIAYGFEVEGLIENMRMLGDVAAAFAMPMTDMSYLYGTLRAQGRAYTRDMNQFANRGIPIWKEMAKVMGVAEKDVRALVEAGKVGFPEVEQAFKNMTSEGGIAFNMMEEQSKSFLGQVSNIQDSFIKLGRIMGAEFLPAAKKVAEEIARVVGWFEQHPTIAIMAGVFLAVATAAALIIGPILIMIALLPALITGFGLLSAVTLPMTLTILAIAAAIAALIVIGVLLIKHWDKVRVVVHNLGIEFQNAFIGIRNVVVKVWNYLVDYITGRINDIIGLVNKFITKVNKVHGISFELIEEVNFEGFKGSMKDYGVFDTFKKEAEEGAEAIKEVNKELSKQEQLVQQLKGYKFIPSTGDIFDPNAKSFLRSDFASNFAFEQAGTRQAGMVINIENLSGLDPGEISRALSQELNTKLSL